MPIRIFRHWPLTAWFTVVVVLAAVLVLAVVKGRDVAPPPSPVATGVIGACGSDLLAVRDTLPALAGAMGNTQELSLAAQTTAASARVAAQRNTGTVKALLERLAEQASLAVGAAPEAGRVQARSVLATADLAAAACVEPNNPAVLDALARNPGADSAVGTGPSPDPDSSPGAATGDTAG